MSAVVYDANERRFDRAVAMVPHNRTRLLIFAENYTEANRWMLRNEIPADVCIYVSGLKVLSGINLDEFAIAQVRGWRMHPQSVYLEERLRALMSGCLNAPYFYAAEPGYRPRPAETG